MSLRISGDKLAIRRETNLPSSFANFTICVFAKLAVAHSTYTSNLVYGQTAAGTDNAQILVKGGSGLSLIGASAYEANQTSAIATLTAGGASGANWFYTAMRGNAAGAGGLKYYHAPIGGSFTTATLTNSAGTSGWGALNIGDAPFDAGAFGVDAWWFDGYVAHLKIYNRALSDAEVEAEAAQGTPASTTDLISYHAFTDSTLSAALIPQQGSGTFVAFTGNPTMSTDNPVLVANPTYSGSVIIPGVLTVSQSGVPPLFSHLLSRR